LGVLLMTLSSLSNLAVVGAGEFKLYYIILCAVNHLLDSSSNADERMCIIKTMWRCDS
jgi:hypothetical protein